MSRIPFSFKHVLLAGAMTGLAATALAQTPPAAPPAGDATAPQAREHRHQRPADAQRQRPDPAQWAAKREQRTAQLKQELGITAEQEPAWHAFTASMLPPAPPARPDHEALRNMTTPERIERMRTLRDARAAEMDQRAEAVLRLYAALTPEQQQKFDRRHDAALDAGPHPGPRPHRGTPPRPEPHG